MSIFSKKFLVALFVAATLLFQSGMSQNAMAASAEDLVAQAEAFYEQDAFDKSFPLFKEAAEMGDAAAQFYLAESYECGYGVAENIEEAAKWAKKSAEQGDPDAQNLLGLYYDEGLGVPQNATEAVAWFRKAAEQGLADGEYNLGICYLDGTGIEINEEEALAWISKAAAQGYEEAAEALIELGLSL